MKKISLIHQSLMSRMLTAKEAKRIALKQNPNAFIRIAKQKKIRYNPAYNNEVNNILENVIFPEIKKRAKKGEMSWEFEHKGTVNVGDKVYNLITNLVCMCLWNNQNNSDKCNCCDISELGKNLKARLQQLGYLVYEQFYELRIYWGIN